MVTTTVPESRMTAPLKSHVDNARPEQPMELAATRSFRGARDRHLLRLLGLFIG
jgi:hypothetical protein